MRWLSLLVFLTWGCGDDAVKKAPFGDVGAVSQDAGTVGDASDGVVVEGDGVARDTSVEPQTTGAAPHATCGDEIVNGTELCDGDCPRDCQEPSHTCETVTYTGSPSTCDAACVVEEVSVCADDDGCCPIGCNSDTDRDCVGLPGASCNSNDDCDGECSFESLNGFTNGYCVRECGGGCPWGTHCTGNSCADSCLEDSHCRAGYVCADIYGDSTRECVSTGTGQRAPGDSCERSDQCAGGAGTQCLRRAMGLDHGYCLPPAADGCPNGSHVFLESFCAASCESDFDCRGDGYGCYDFDGDGQNECWSKGTGSGRVGSTCGETAECYTNTFGMCIPDEWNFYGGYCSRRCEADEHCGPDAVCHQGVVADYCVQECTSPYDCRAGYSCLDLGAGRRGCVSAAALL